MGQRILFVVTVITAVVGYLVLKEPIPDGSTKPYALKWVMFQSRLAMDYLPILAEAVGYSSVLDVRRYLVGQNRGWNAPGVKAENATFDGVPVRIFTPDGGDVSVPSDGLPGVVYIHGGGWVLSSIETYHHHTSRIADDLQAVVVSVDYRLAPEFKYSDCLADVLTSYKYFVNNAQKYKVNPNKVITMGDSAGGNLVAALSLKLRAEKFKPQPVLQVPIYPVVQALDLNLPSYQQNSGGPWLTRDLMGWFFSYTLLGDSKYMDIFIQNTHVPKRIREKYAKRYLNHQNVPPNYRYSPYNPVTDEEDGDESVWEQIKDTVLDPYFSPLLADDLSGLPPTIVYTGQHDVLRDEGILYVQRLKESGVDVDHIVDPLGWHPCITFWPLDPDAENAVAAFHKKVKERIY